MTTTPTDNAGKLSEANARLVETVDGWALAEECDLPLDRIEKLMNAARSEGPTDNAGETRDGWVLVPFCGSTEFLLCMETSTMASYAKGKKLLAHLQCTNPTHIDIVVGPAAETDHIGYGWGNLNPEAVVAWNRRAPTPQAVVSEGMVEVGEAGSMPGTDGFTMAAFRAADVPIGTKLYVAALTGDQP
jgi:hypothetical protein